MHLCASACKVVDVAIHTVRAARSPGLPYVFVPTRSLHCSCNAMTHVWGDVMTLHRPNAPMCVCNCVRMHHMRSLGVPCLPVILNA